MRKAQQRISVISKHLHDDVGLSPCVEGRPSLTITPDVALVDEKVHIRLTGLKPGESVTLRASLEEGNCKFESRGVYRASQNGTIDNRIDQSIAGSFLGIEPMGLFWSLKPAPGQNPYTRMIKKDVTTPLVITVDVFNGNMSDDTEITQIVVTSTVVHRFYKRDTVRRIPVKHEKFRGTIFVPEGPGPFPGVADLYGGMVTLCETRAALLASRGYATYALSFLPIDNKDPSFTDGFVHPSFIQDAITWFSKRDYVDEHRVGCVGLCYGGFLSLICAAMSPLIKVLVSINSLCILPFSRIELTMDGRYVMKDAYFKKQWPETDRVYETEEGLVSKDVHECDDAIPIPAWGNGAKLFMIGCEDDYQMDPKWCRIFVSSVPAEYKQNVKMAIYPGAGHLLEPPYSPLCRKTKPPAARMIRAGFTNKALHGKCFMSGGFLQPHAAAQEDMWRHLLDFLGTHL